jgi:phage gp45-like
MGMIATLLKLARGKLETVGNAPGPSVAMQGEGFEGQTVTTEVYQAPGVLAIPGDGARGVWLPIGGSGRYGVVVALQNYALNITIEAGETAIYSTTADGQTVQALVKLKADGTIELNGNSKRLVTWDELDAALQSLKTALNSHTHPTAATGPPSPPTVPLSIDITAAKTTTLKTGG